MGNWHECSMCCQERVPVWRALCRNCFPIVPWELRLSFTRAYRRRVFDPVAWQESKIEGRQWFLDQVKRDEK